MEAEWQFPEQKSIPMSISFSPQLKDNSSTFLNQFLGYPICPIIGRYNRGEYKMSDILMHIEFKCKFDHKRRIYFCGDKAIHLPQLMLYNIRNIPEVIMLNKLNLKDAPDAVPQQYPVLDQLTLIWCLSFGEFGKDFLNYLNHMYILADRLFLDEKLKRHVHYLPIYAYQPAHSGLHPEEVEKGLNFQQYRGEYLSFHLSKGSPAFSPNNMRIAVEGGKIINSNQQTKQGKKEKVKYVEKQQYENEKNKKKEMEDKPKEEIEKNEKEQELPINFEQLQQANKISSEKIDKALIKENENNAQNKQKQENVEQKKGQGNIEKQEKGKKKNKNNNANWKENKEKYQVRAPTNHQGYIHFYTSVLLEKDYRIYYHWHIQSQEQEQIIREIFKNCFSLEQFRQNYVNFLGKDPLIEELNSLIFENSPFA